ncbi:hypothetical protein [Synechocystis sp. PCC 7509]|uniref:hypothetical protein n=1 Tax=Synechocystis sp. PCC 7509 TaxID=927677 RepID=UPI0002ACD340|nr:hypothetical protein [Synechocystis sp. PCC 7509]
MKKVLIASLTIAVGVFAGNELISFKNSPNTYFLSDAQRAKRAAIENCKAEMTKTVQVINQSAELHNQRIVSLGGEFNDGFPEMGDKELEERCKNVRY